MVLSILVAGFVEGLIAGIGYRVGVSPSEGGISRFIFKSFCQAIAGQTQFDCWNYYWMLWVLVIIVAILTFFFTIFKAKDWRVGLFLYLLGAIPGFLLMFMVGH